MSKKKNPKHDTLNSMNTLPKSGKVIMFYATLAGMRVNLVDVEFKQLACRTIASIGWLPLPKMPKGGDNE